MSSASKTNQTKQRLATSKSLLASRKSSKKWRAKHYNLPTNRNAKFTITIRRFTTPPARRSTRYKQFVWSVGLLGIKEIAFKLNTQNNPTSKRGKFPNRLVLSFSRTMIIAGLFGLMFFSFQLYTVSTIKPPVVEAQSVSSPISETVEQQSPDFLPYSKPVSIIIPSIQVSSVIGLVGQNPDGSMQTPELFSNQVGWYIHGPTPGELGPAILVGHVDNYKGPSVFWNLGNVSINDVVEILREDGTTVQFSAYAVQQFDQDFFPTQEVYGDVTGAEIRLITCGGSYSPILGRYTANTVVFAKML